MVLRLTFIGSFLLSNAFGVWCKPVIFHAQLRLKKKKKHWFGFGVRQRKSEWKVRLLEHLPKISDAIET